MKKSKTSGIVVGKGGGTGIGSIRYLSKKQKLLAGVLVAVLVVGGVGLYILTRPNTVHLPTEAEYYQQRISTLSSMAASGSTADRLKNYDELVKAQAATGDYHAAIATFKTREALSTAGLDYIDYYHLATYYEHVGDKTAAIAALDKAAPLVPADDPSSGFLHADAEARIAAYKAELSK